MRFTELLTAAGKLYLATVIDLYSRRLLGAVMSRRPDAELACSAIRMAVAARADKQAITGVVFHTDRGSTYTAERFARLCRTLGIRQSMGRVGSCFDCEHSVRVTTWSLTLAYDRPCGCPRVDVSAPGGGGHQAAGRVLIGA